MEKIGKIYLIKAYQTTDGKKFTGNDAKERAEDHQRWIDRQASNDKRSIDALMANVEENKEWPIVPVNPSRGEDRITIRREDLPKRKRTRTNETKLSVQTKKRKGARERK